MCKAPEVEPIEPQIGVEDEIEIEVEEPVELTVEMLESLPKQQRDDMLGEHLFPRILEMRLNIWMVGKITGMLLELSNVDVLYLLGNNYALEAKVREAEELLRTHLIQKIAAITVTLE